MLNGAGGADRAEGGVSELWAELRGRGAVPGAGPPVRPLCGRGRGRRAAAAAGPRARGRPCRLRRHVHARPGRESGAAGRGRCGRWSEGAIYTNMHACNTAWG